MASTENPRAGSLSRVPFWPSGIWQAERRPRWKFVAWWQRRRHVRPAFIDERGTYVSTPLPSGDKFSPRPPFCLPDARGPKRHPAQWTGPRVFCTSHRGWLATHCEWYVKCQSNFFRIFSEYFRKFIKKYIQPEITYRVISIFINISEIFLQIYDCYLQYVYR